MLFQRTLFIHFFSYMNTKETVLLSKKVATILLGTLAFGGLVGVSLSTFQPAHLPDGAEVHAAATKISRPQCLALKRLADHEQLSTEILERRKLDPSALLQCESDFSDIWPAFEVSQTSCSFLKKLFEDAPKAHAFPEFESRIVRCNDQFQLWKLNKDAKEPTPRTMSGRTLISPTQKLPQRNNNDNASSEGKKPEMDHRQIQNANSNLPTREPAGHK